MNPVPERTAAKAAGERHYETGKPCKNGHIAKRYTSSGICVVCDAERHAKWLAARPGLEAKWARERRAKDPTAHRAEVKRWAQKNPEKHRALHKRWVERHPDLNRERNRAYMQKWCDENRELHNENTRRSRLRDPIATRQQYVATAAKRRQRAIENGGSFTKDDIVALQTMQKGKCAECSKKLKQTHVDHIIPLVLGGRNDPSNLQLLCPTCNMQKGKLHPLEWAKKRGRLL